MASSTERPRNRHVRDRVTTLNSLLNSTASPAAYAETTNRSVSTTQRHNAHGLQLTLPTTSAPDSFIACRNQVRQRHVLILVRYITYPSIRRSLGAPIPTVQEKTFVVRYVAFASRAHSMHKNGGGGEVITNVEHTSRAGFLCPRTLT